MECRFLFKIVCILLCSSIFGCSNNEEQLSKLTEREKLFLELENIKNVKKIKAKENEYDNLKAISLDELKVLVTKLKSNKIITPTIEINKKEETLTKVGAGEAGEYAKVFPVISPNNMLFTFGLRIVVTDKNTKSINANISDLPPSLIWGNKRFNLSSWETISDVIVGFSLDIQSSMYIRDTPTTVYAVPFDIHFVCNNPSFDPEYYWITSGGL